MTLRATTACAKRNWFALFEARVTVAFDRLHSGQVDPGAARFAREVADEAERAGLTDVARRLRKAARDNDDGSQYA